MYTCLLTYAYYFPWRSIGRQPGMCATLLYIDTEYRIHGMNRNTFVHNIFHEVISTEVALKTRKDQIAASS